MTRVNGNMTLMLDSEPTLEANAADTQSIHAWSQEDPATEVVDYRPRSWKLPITVAAAALIGIAGAGTYLAWPDAPVKPQQSATKAQVAPTPKPVIPSSAPVQPMSPDQRFIALLKQHGRVISEPLAIKAAHWVCDQEKQGIPDPQLAQLLVEGTPGSTLESEAIFVDLAREVYCN